MILLNYQSSGRTRLGVKTRYGVMDVTTAITALGHPYVDVRFPDTMEELLEGGPPALEALSALVKRAEASGPNRSFLRDESELHFAPPVSNPRRILLLGLNYKSHADEQGRDLPEYPLLFSKFSSCIAASGEAIPIPRPVQQADYEAELAVVIGRRAHYVAEEQALDYVFGYCNANDLSARDLQYRTSQFLLGKAFDHFYPMGPYLVTADEVGDPHNLSIKSFLNGEPRQNANTGEMIFKVPFLVSYCSQFFPLEPGDIISTGTPEGVIKSRKNPEWLKPGDEVVVEIEGLGRLVNVMAEETA